MTTRRGFLGALAAFHYELSGVYASTYISLPKSLPTIVSAHAETLEPGRWAKLPAALNQNAALTQMDSTWLSGSSNKASWDPIRKTCHYIGKRQRAFPHQHVVYREASHDWVKLWEDLAVPLGRSGHGYDYNNIDPMTGRLFFKKFGNVREVYYADPPNYEWSSSNVLPLWPRNGGFVAPAMPSFFWQGAMTSAGRRGLLGIFVHADRAGDCDFMLYDVAVGAWQAPIKVIGAGASSHRWGDYSAYHNCAICAAANPNDDGEDRLWRLNSDASVTQMPSAPRPLGYLRGNFIADPTTGDFLLMANDGTFWALDPTGNGTWTQLGDAPSELWPLTKIGTICWDIPAYRVTVWATHKGDMWLYKHPPRS